VILPNFASRRTDVFFGVFDGHGRDGDKCALYVRDNLPPLLAKAVDNHHKKQLLEHRNKVGDLDKDFLHAALHKSHMECNQKMHLCESVDDSLSGTTSISVYLHGTSNRITVSNVGDSRAVIGRKEKDNLKAFALSNDQTPYRKDERIRCRKAGARILSLDQIEGLEPVPVDEEGDENELLLGEEIDEGGDPPRIWSPNGDYPGTAFTRSIGDGIAEELGVCAQPEILGRELSKEDRIIVLASDGVFEVSHTTLVSIVFYLQCLSPVVVLVFDKSKCD